MAGPILEILETSGERDYQEGGLEVCFQGPFLIPKSVSVFLQNLFCLGAVLFFRPKVKGPTGHELKFLLPHLLVLSVWPQQQKSD